MKKIGILTFHNVPNYGAALQAFALNRIINQLNYDCKIINYFSDDLLHQYKLINFRNRGIKNFLKNTILIKKNYYRNKKFILFQKKYYRQTEPIKRIKKLTDVIHDFDYIITGSDQVWNKDITKESSDIYFLNFFATEKPQKISYAASFGTDKIKYKDDLKLLLKDFKSISVREESANRILHEVDINNVEVVIDPTMLLTRDEWNSIFKPIELKEPYILVYMLQKDDFMIDFVNKFTSNINLKVIHFGAINRYKVKTENKYCSGPDEFINLIRNAKYVITNSFHGVVFSIIFKKELFVIPHRTRNTRIENLLSKLKLEDRMILNNDYNIVKLLQKKINYDIVDEKFADMRGNSIDFLKRSFDEKN